MKKCSNFDFRSKFKKRNFEIKSIYELGKFMILFEGKKKKFIYINSKLQVNKNNLNFMNNLILNLHLYLQFLGRQLIFFLHDFSFFLL